MFVVVVIVGGSGTGGAVITIAAVIMPIICNSGGNGILYGIISLNFFWCFIWCCVTMIVLTKSSAGVIDVVVSSFVDDIFF